MRLINSFLIGLLIPSLALANYPPTTIKGQTDASAKTKFGFQVPFQQSTDLGGTASLIETGNSNILPNPGFERLTLDWSATVTGTVSKSTGSKGTGIYGIDWDDGLGSGAILAPSLIAIPEGFKGKNGTLSCDIKLGASGTITQTMTVNTGSSDVVSPQLISANTSTFTRNTINFIFPSSGSIKPIFYGNNNADPNIYIDDCRLGLADNIGTVQQARLIGTVTVTGCSAAWSTTSTTYASFATQTGCSYAVTGEALAPTTNIPAIRFASLPPGEYKVEYEGALFTQATAGRQDADFQIFDGTNQYRETSAISATSVGDFKPNFMASYSYTAPQNNITLQVRAKTSNSQTTQIYGTTSRPGVIRVYYFPSASQQAVSSAQADYDWTAYTPTFSAGLGTVSPATVTLKHKRIADTLYIRGNFTLGTVAASLASFTLPTGLSIDTTKLSGGSTNQFVGTAITDLATVNSTKGATILASPSNSSTSLYMSLQDYTATGSALTPKNGNAIFQNNSVVSVDISVPISTWTGNQRAPTLVGSVTSNSNGAERIERASVTASCTITPCTIAKQSGSWLTSITRSTTGTYSVNYPSGTFSDVPTCTVSTANTGNASPGGQQMCDVGTVTTTAAPVICGIPFSNSLADSTFQIICMGPR